MGWIAAWHNRQLRPRFRRIAACQRQGDARPVVGQPCERIDPAGSLAMPDFALPPLLQNLPPLLLLGAGAALVAFAGGLVARRLPWTGATLRVIGNFVLAGVLMLAAMRFVRLDPQFDALMPRFGMPVQSVAGGETRVPLSADGHYWIEASVNGSNQRFMVDTGATLSALSAGAARAAGVEPDPLRLPVLVRTAGGTTRAELAHLEDLRFGNIVAKDLDAIIAGETGGLNVLGMNFLSRLKGWRVEDGVLILSPRNGPANSRR